MKTVQVLLRFKPNMTTMLFTVCIAIFVLGGAFASSIANNYIENVLSYNLKNQISMMQLDPASIPDFSTELKDKISFITVKVKANYTAGNITGLSNAVRYSECLGPTFSFGQKKINCTIGFNSLQSHFNGKIKYGKVPQVNFKANGNITTTTLFVEIVQQPGSNVGQLANLQVHWIGEVKPKFTGLGSALNKQLKFLEDEYRMNVKTALMSLITTRFNYALNIAVSQLPMPM